MNVDGERPHRLLARALALALAESPVQGEIERAIRRSPHREGKVLLHDLVRDARAARLRSVMEREVSAAGDTLQGLVQQIPEVEVYLPIANQRRQLGRMRIEQVATQLSDMDEIAAYSTTGVRRTLDSAVAPTAITLALVRRESDASEYVPRLDYRDGGPSDLLHGNPSISALVADCDDPEDAGCAGGDTSPTPRLDVPEPTIPRPDGLFVEYFELTDFREAWIKGNPEVEVWLYGTMRGVYQGSVSGGAAVLSFSSSASRAVAVDCAGDTRVDDGQWRFFDLDSIGPIRPTRPVFFGAAARLRFRDLTGTGGNPNVLLQERLVWLQPPYAVQVIERDDDRGGCPVPPTDRPWNVQIGYDAVTGKPILNGVSWSDVLAWVTTPNDELIYREFDSWQALASARWIRGAYGGITIGNQGFPSSPPGSGETIVFREPCVLGPFRSPAC